MKVDDFESPKFGDIGENAYICSVEKSLAERSLNMQNKSIFLVLFFAVSLACNGQPFLKHYRTLTSDRLEEFFAEWKAYSDNVCSKNSVDDRILAEVVKQEYAAFERENKTRPKFRVFPEVITVYKYANNADTTSTFYDHTFEESGRFKTQSITPAIPRGALCMTYFVKLTLSKYVGGVLYKGEILPVNAGNETKLRDYLSVGRGVRRQKGHIWFESFPLIEEISVAPNLIAVKRRTSSSTGNVIWYVRKDGKFKRRDKPVSSWVD